MAFRWRSGRRDVHLSRLGGGDGCAVRWAQGRALLGAVQGALLGAPRVVLCGCRVIDLTEGCVSALGVALRWELRASLLGPLREGLLPLTAILPLLGRHPFLLLSCSLLSLHAAAAFVTQAHVKLSLSRDLSWNISAPMTDSARNPQHAGCTFIDRS